MANNNLIVSHGVVNVESLKYHSNRILDMQVAKNKDYGNSIEQGINKRGWMYLMIQLENKLNRFEQLITNNPAVVQEAIHDTLDDIVGYALHGTTIAHGKIEVPVAEEFVPVAPRKPMKKSKADLITLCNDLQSYYDEHTMSYEDVFYLLNDLSEVIKIHIHDFEFSERSNVKVRVRKPEQRITILPYGDFSDKLKHHYEDGYKEGTRDEMNRMKEKRKREEIVGNSLTTSSNVTNGMVNGVNVNNAKTMSHSKSALEFFNKYVLPHGKMIVHNSTTFICFDNKLWLVKKDTESLFSAITNSLIIVPYNNMLTISTICNEYFEEKVVDENIDAINKAMSKSTETLMQAYTDGVISISEIDGLLAMFNEKVTKAIEENTAAANEVCCDDPVVCTCGEGEIV